MIPTDGPKRAGQLARAAADGGAKLVVVAGGDGTLNEAAQGLLGTRVPMAILPGGTANVLAVETRIGTNMERAAARLLGMTAIDIPVGVLTMAGRGAEGLPGDGWRGSGCEPRQASQQRPQAKVGQAELLAGRFRPDRQAPQEFDVRWDGGAKRASFVLASRVRNYGGDLEIARHANLLDDELALVIFEGASSFRYLKYFSGRSAEQVGRDERCDGHQGIAGWS